MEYEKVFLPCPLCNYSRLIDTVVGIESETIPENEIPAGWKPDYFQKCKGCKKEIGIRKVS